MSYIDCCDWDKCTLCGECLERCPVMEMPHEEAVREFERLLKGEEAPRVMSECTLCFRCNRYCPEDLRPFELILQRVAEGDSRKDGIPAFLLYMLNAMPPENLFQNVYGSMGFAEKEILRRWSEPPPASEEVLFVGCIGKMFCQDIENSSVLSSLPKFGPTDICCGELHYRSGLWDAYSQIAERTLKRFAALETGRMVCYCGSCYYFLSDVLPNVYGQELPFEVTSLFQWLLEKYEEGEVEPVRPIEGDYAVHESCYAGTLGPDFYEPLRKLYRAAGVNLSELEHNRESGLSCGMCSVARDFGLGGLFKVQNTKYQEVRDTGVRDVALNCPGCFYTMSVTAWMHGVKLHYMPEELLRAFGDEITSTAASRIPLFYRNLLRGLPLAFRKVPARAPHIEP
jgi:Fe-S oxidoreductase